MAGEQRLEAASLGSTEGWVAVTPEDQDRLVGQGRQQALDLGEEVATMDDLAGQHVRGHATLCCRKGAAVGGEHGLRQSAATHADAQTQLDEEIEPTDQQSTKGTTEQAREPGQPAEM